MRLTPPDAVDHVDLNRSVRRPSSSHEERILRGNPPPASFCENLVLAVFSTFSTESAMCGRLATNRSRLREEQHRDTCVDASGAGDKRDPLSERGQFFQKYNQR